MLGYVDINKGDIKYLNVVRSLVLTASCGKLFQSLTVFAKRENLKPLR